jgi:hypothetical protein
MAELLKSLILDDVDHAIERVEAQHVKLGDREALRSYLARHTLAADILLPAAAIARSHLGDTPQLSLEVYRDPEFGGEQLSLYVRSEHYSASFLNSLQAAAAEVGSVRAGKDETFLVISNFQPPR